MLTNEALMLAYQRGDATAFAELVTRHEQPLWSFLRRQVQGDAVAEDLLQETFMRVIHGAASYRPNAKFSTWLYTIARNLCIDHARKQKHRRALSLDGHVGHVGHVPGDEDSSPRLHERVAGGDRGAEHDAQNRELGARLDRALAALPEQQREVFLMREVLNLPFAEIARAVDASEPTVKSRMRYALQRLREALSESTPAPPRTAAEVEP